ncbi:uncharacterized protein BX663DRAFT_512755 [Cokeromyces recurvatus]|uniref:uncharacterized protein n=1 Tax=Cokeromyces recurvatus TaxID=90255 RepID=UPI0022209D24|nr:uncharacterized protein BX663DRAFT_512755 [Cokeromyces recurvatus]KAI7901891.1 hypothetical protein BX663DRAFT_512755 [Cokeromyces recurvatus]
MSNANKTGDKEKQVNLGAACFRCRGFRHACDRKKPNCTRCQRRGINCVYPEAAPTLKKLQKATETLGDRIKKLNDRLKSTEIVAPMLCYQQQQQQQQHSTTRCKIDLGNNTSSLDNDDLLEEPPYKRKIRLNTKVASTSNFSVYPCTKCFKDLQQCDLTFPKCSRCKMNNFDCEFKKSEPKANHISQVLHTMNKMMDQWQDSLDRMAKDFAQKTKDFSTRTNQSLKIKPIQQQTVWKIISTKKGLSVESNVSSYNDLSTLVDQFQCSMSTLSSNNSSLLNTHKGKEEEIAIEFDDTQSIRTASSGFAIWDSWAHSNYTIPQGYPIDISPELTDNLVDLYCRAHCCSTVRLPIIDTSNFLLRYRDPNPEKRPAKVLIYAICSMAARNAFQLHVWSKQPSSDVPHYNMGKALSVAYCLRGRELLSECFDEPTLEHCQAAFLLSYCNYQNGYPNVIYFYEWIAYNMAQELGLYDTNRVLTRYESMLIWCIYYFNAWYKVLQGNKGTGSAGLSQCRPPLESIPCTLSIPETGLTETDNKESDAAIIDYYAWNSWVYIIHLQILREQTMSVLMTGNTDSMNQPKELLAMQKKLEEFNQSLPEEWQSLDLDLFNNANLFNHSGSPFSFSSSSSCCSPQSPCSEVGQQDIQKTDDNEKTYFSIDVKSFSHYCINMVSLCYNINRILLYQPFAPMDRVPSTPLSVQSLKTSLNAANNITQIIEAMVQQRENCHIPIMVLLFANIVYRKLMSYNTNKDYYEIGRMGLLHCLDISKSSISYTYDFEMARTLVDVMEKEIQHNMNTIKPTITTTTTTTIDYLTSSDIYSSSQLPSITTPII